MASKQYNILPDNKESTDKEIKDNKSLIYWVAMLLGCGILTSYNFLVSAPDYFNEQYPNYPNINMLIVPAYTIPDVIFLVLAVVYGHLFSFTSRIVICFTIMGLFMLFPIFTQYVSSSQHIGFYTILSVSGFCGITTAVLQTAIVGFCNYLPTNYIQVSISGQSVAGILAGSIRIAINSIEQNTSMNSQTNGMIYFGIGAFVDILCGIAFLYAIRSAFVKFHLSEYFWTRKYRPSLAQNDDPLMNDLLQRTNTQTILRKLVDNTMNTPTAKDFKSITFPNGSRSDRSEQQIIAGQKKKAKQYKQTTNDSDTDESSSILNTDNEFDATERAEIACSHTQCIGSIQSGTQSVSTNSVKRILSIDKPALLSIEKAVDDNNPEAVAIVDDKATFCGVFRKLKLLAFSLFLVFFVTFLMFPGLITSLKSQYKSVNDNNWFPVWLVMEFNVCDLIGRQFFAAHTSFSFSKKSIWIGCFWRILIYPLFIAIYKGIINNDIITYAAMAILGITNGHFCCLIFMWAPSLVTAQEQQLCGSIMSFGLVMGITAGSNVALLLHSVGIL